MTVRDACAYWTCIYELDLPATKANVLRSSRQPTWTWGWCALQRNEVAPPYATVLFWGCGGSRIGSRIGSRSENEERVRWGGRAGGSLTWTEGGASLRTRQRKMVESPRETLTLWGNGDEMTGSARRPTTRHQTTYNTSPDDLQHATSPLDDLQHVTRRPSTRHQPARRPTTRHQTTYNTSPDDLQHATSPLDDLQHVTRRPTTRHQTTYNTSPDDLQHAISPLDDLQHVTRRPTTRHQTTFNTPPAR